MIRIWICDILPPANVIVVRLRLHSDDRNLLRKMNGLSFGLELFGHCREEGSCQFLPSVCNLDPDDTTLVIKLDPHVIVQLLAIGYRTSSDCEVQDVGLCIIVGSQTGLA